VAQAHKGKRGFDRVLRELTETGVARLRAEIASAEGRHGEALQQQALAVTASQRADDNEPPMLAAGARVALGELQLRAGQAADAEKTFREDLALMPANGWALNGLSQALRAQGKPAEAEALKPQLDLAWAQADGALKAAR
jgi:Flp pilus assembly protein TadD